ncbi:hypothetical protein, partial [Siminovitchia fortis]|uniref:hypothetical protein n=1 Tax=Siminovitchia fortis TaxID=254758 RepID=UPI001C930E93
YSIRPFFLQPITTHSLILTTSLTIPHLISLLFIPRPLIFSLYPTKPPLAKPPYYQSTSC